MSSRNPTLSSRFFRLIAVIALASVGAQVSTAKDTAEKSYCMSALGYTSGTERIKKELVENAKRMAIEELFGELITSFTTVEDLVLKEDVIRSISVGYIRVRGVPAFSNGVNFGEVCVSLEAYTTEEDRDKLRPKRIAKKNCTADRNITTRELIEQAKASAIISGLLDYDRRLESLASKDMLRLVHDVDYIESGFVPDTETYCVRVEGTVYPVEILATTGGDASTDKLGGAADNLKDHKVASAAAIKFTIDGGIDYREVRLSEIEFDSGGEPSFYVDSCSFSPRDSRWSCDYIVDGDPATSWAGSTAQGGSLPYWFVLKAKRGEVIPLNNIRIYTGNREDYPFRPTTFSVYISADSTESWHRICHGRLDRSTEYTWDVFGCTRPE